MADELWKCPDCGRRFANRNQWHSCTEMALEQHLASKSDLAVELYRGFEAAVRKCGDFRIHPQETRIAFIARMTFGGAELARRWIDISFILPYPVGDERIRTLDMYGPTGFGHQMRLTDPAELDDAVQQWLCDAYRRGLQETLDPRAEVEPVTGPALERLRVPLRTTVVPHHEDLALRIPAWAADAFEAHPGVLVRIAGDEHPAHIEGHGDSVKVVFAVGTLQRLSLGVGDDTDAYLTADL